MKRIRNYVQSLPDIATSGQPVKEQFREIAKGGYAIIVNLAMPDHHDSIENEGKIITELGMIYFHLPVPFDKPTREHVRIFCRIMAALTGKKIWVHCIMNYRVSAFMFHYLNKIIPKSCSRHAVKPHHCSCTENVETGADTRRQVNFGTGVLLVHRARNS